jgi:hypothetical protein
MCQVLYRDDGAPRLRPALRRQATYAYTTAGALRRLGACPTDDAARRAVQRECVVVSVDLSSSRPRRCDAVSRWPRGTGGGGGLDPFGLTPLGWWWPSRPGAAVPLHGFRPCSRL